VRKLLTGTLFRGVVVITRSMAFFLMGVVTNDVPKSVIVRAKHLYSRVCSGNAAKHGKEGYNGKNAFHDKLLRFRNE
jgi:hypothetical protein